jgi:hypothetical protein
MDSIDLALKSWDSLLNKGKEIKYEKERLFTLKFLRLSCEKYLQDRDLKDSPLAAARKAVVQEVLRSCEAAESYVKKRATPAANLPGTKSLDGAYANERTHYLASNKQSNPYSASALHGKGAHDTYQDFIALGAQSGGEQVEFMNRGERMKYLLVVKNGLLYQGGALYSCTVKRIRGESFIEAATYAMDKYGNLFSKKEAVASKDSLRFNHSTYCSGKEIICAGTLACLDGHLLKITNSSGHYKPTGSNVRSALIMLGQEGVALQDVSVEGQGLVVNDGVCRAETLARTGPRAAADWPFQPVYGGSGPAPNTALDYNGEHYEVWEPG